MNRNNFLNIKNKDLVDLIISRKGGKLTSDIIDIILTKPHNANEISKMLKVDYNTIIYHTKIMEEQECITKKQQRRTKYIHPSDKLINNLDEYNYIKKFIDKK